MYDDIMDYKSFFIEVFNRGLESEEYDEKHVTEKAKNAKGEKALIRRRREKSEDYRDIKICAKNVDGDDGKGNMVTRVIKRRDIT